MNERLRDLLAEVLELERTAVTPGLRRDETDTWDSLNHLRLITAIEAEFGASFTMEEITAIRLAGELEQIIDARAAVASQA